jgi:glycosyltransferase involved in cell wall biosynthesis
MRILLPISLDRWRNPIATLLRACVEANPGIEFFSHANPFSEEDATLASSFWSLPNVVALSQRQLCSTRYDLVHTASITLHNQAAVLAAKARSWGNCRYLATVNLQVGPHDGKDWQLLRCAEHLADRIVSVSHAAGAGTMQRCYDRYCGVIPNGFDPVYFDPSINDDEALPSAVRTMAPGSFGLYVGALEPRKHPEMVVKLAKSNPDLTFVAAGYVHPDGRHFEPMIKSQSNLLWLGHVDRRCIRALMRRAGVFLFPSEREGLALSVIEAMGMGLPVIAQPKSSMPELIEHNDNGTLHDISDHQAWSGSLRTFLQWNDEKRAAFRGLTRVAAIARFDWSVIGRQYGNLYRKIVSQSNG